MDILSKGGINQFERSYIQTLAHDIFIAAGMIGKVLPRELMTQWLGEESGMRGLILGTLAGLVTPGGHLFNLDRSTLNPRPEDAGLLQAELEIVSVWGKDLYGETPTIASPFQFSQDGLEGDGPHPQGQVLIFFAGIVAQMDVPDAVCPPLQEGKGPVLSRSDVGVPNI